MEEHRTLWQTAWGIVAVIAGAAFIALVVARITSDVPLGAIIAVGILMLAALYLVFAPAARWWPFGRDAAASVPTASGGAGGAGFGGGGGPDGEGAAGGAGGAGMVRITSPDEPVIPAEATQPIFDEAPPELADMTLASLHAIVASRTEAQASKLMDLHRGKPVRVSGNVEGVGYGAGGELLQVNLRSGAVLFLLFFDSDDESLVLALNVGDRIVVSGAIQQITDPVIALVNCNLIEVRGEDARS